MVEVLNRADFLALEMTCFMPTSRRICLRLAALYILLSWVIASFQILSMERRDGMTESEAVLKMPSFRRTTMPVAPLLPSAGN